MDQSVIDRQIADGNPNTSEPNRPRGKVTSYVLVIVLLLIFAAAAVIGLLLRASERRALAKETETLAVPTVVVVHPKLEAPQQELVLPSTLQAFTESPIYARTNGYLAHWYKDIGSRVQTGELLADIETPEIDQELLQARATRDQAEDQMKLAETSAKRYENLQKMDAVAQQETDERSSAYLQGQAQFANATANLRRLGQLESFKHIYAPFSGVITKRNIDIGALINAGNSGPNQELFDMAKLDPIRVYVDVPEIYVPAIRKGVQATIELASLPGQHFTGAVARTADSIDLTTRRMRTEIDVPNPKGVLLPGAYAQVHFDVNIKTLRLSVPVNALLFRAEGLRAAVVGSDGKVHLKPVVIGRDYGTTLEVLGGLEQNDALILNPSDSLEEGQQVKVSTQGGGNS